MRALVLAALLAAGPESPSVLLQGLQPVVPPTWTMVATPTGVTLTRAAPARVMVRGLGDRFPTTVSLVLTMGARLLPKDRAARLAKTTSALEALAKKMEPFATGSVVDSEPEYRPTTEAQRAQVMTLEALRRQLEELPAWYVGDFVPVTVTTFLGANARRRDDVLECDDCDQVLAAVQARLSSYPSTSAAR